MAFVNQKNKNNKKLSKVLSTKLSIDDYNSFLVLTKLEYEAGLIKEESTSELLRFTIRHILEQVHNQPEYLILKQEHNPLFLSNHKLYHMNVKLIISGYSKFPSNGQHPESCLVFRCSWNIMLVGPCSVFLQLKARRRCTYQSRGYKSCPSTIMLIKS
jgi:hypothetical protein